MLQVFTSQGPATAPLEPLFANLITADVKIRDFGRDTFEALGRLCRRSCGGPLSVSDRGPQRTLFTFQAPPELSKESSQRPERLWNIRLKGQADPIQQLALPTTLGMDRPQFGQCVKDY